MWWSRRAPVRERARPGTRRAPGGSRGPAWLALIVASSALVGLAQESAPRRPSLPFRPDCHEDRTAGALVHAPVAAGRCRACHVPLARLEHAFLPAVDPARTCATCHRLPERRHRHEPVARGRCLACHRPHRSRAPALLSRYPVDRLCGSCHPRQVRAGSAARHQRVGCLGCHDPHASYHPRLLRAAGPSTLYARVQPGTYALCEACHPGTTDPEASRTRFRNGGRNLHAVHARDPSLARTCIVCHDVHGATPALLRSELAYGSWRLELRVDRSPEGGRCAPACHQERRYRR